MSGTETEPEKLDLSTLILYLKDAEKRNRELSVINHKLVRTSMIFEDALLGIEENCKGCPAFAIAYDALEAAEKIRKTGSFH